MIFGVKYLGFPPNVVCKTAKILSNNIQSYCVQIWRATKNNVAGHIWSSGREFDMHNLNHFENIFLPYFKNIDKMFQKYF